MRSVHYRFSEPVAKRYGARLRMLRKQRGLKYREVAAALGITIAVVGKWETGYNPPRAAHVEALARLYGVKIADLYTGIDEEGE